MPKQNLEATQVDWATKVLLEGHSYETEKLRVAELIKDMTTEQMQEFARNYAQEGSWVKRVFPGDKPAKSCKHAEPGGIVCEVGTSTPLIYIGSTSQQWAAVRLVINTNKKSLTKAHNIRAWDKRESERGFFVYDEEKTCITVVRASNKTEAQDKTDTLYPGKNYRAYSSPIYRR